MEDTLEQILKNVDDIKKCEGIDKKLADELEITMKKFVERSRKFLAVQEKMAEYSKFFDKNKDIIGEELIKEFNTWFKIMIGDNDEVDFEMLINKFEEIKTIVNKK